ncbi:MAG: SDR family oxidoreductase [Bacteroidota bacterium]
MLDFQNKNVVVTGGASGIGREICKMFSKADAHVHILDLNDEQAKTLANQLIAEGQWATAHKCDVTSQPEFTALIDKINAEQAIDILINNAGIAHIGTIESTAEEDMDRLYRVNVKGVYNGMRSCIPHFKKSKRGVILNIASIASSAGLPDRFAYSMTKGAVLTMTFSVARDYINHKIRCNCISPARIHTPFVDQFLTEKYTERKKEMFDQLSAAQPLGRMGSPEEVAKLALYLCSDAASFITGNNYLIDGGFTNLR